MAQPAELGGPAPRLRVALVLDLAPRKLGSLERWVVGVVREARGRGHRVDVLAREPLHPDVREALTSLGAGWERVDRLERNPVAAVARLRRYHVIQYHLFGARSRAALFGYLAWPARIILVERTSDWGSERTVFGRLKLRALNLVSTPRIAGLIGVSDYARDRTARLLGLPPERTATIYNGVDLDLFSFRSRSSVREGPITLLAVAHLIPEKGIEHLLRALAAVPPTSARLVLVGDGPEEARLRRLGNELGIATRTRFCGLRDDVASLLQEADVFVHPATWAEAFGWTIAEAMASGCAVIATTVGGIPELIEHGRSGMLVPPGDPAALAETIVKLGDDVAWRLELGRNARRRAEERFGLVQSARQHVDWFERVARRGSRTENGSGE
ncbi:MAG: glycosyltransferase family 4 protein [Gemmatimonadales bacterium]